MVGAPASGSKNSFYPFLLMGGGPAHFAVLETEPDVLELGAGVNRRGVELDDAVHGIFHGRGEDFAVGNVQFAFAGLRADALDAEGQVGAGALEVDAIGFQ